jgi:uncharacterized phiE125 gp8 family phage protein
MIGYSPIGVTPIGATAASDQAGGGTVASDLACVYTVRSAVLSDQASSFAVRAAVAADFAGAFSVRTVVARDLAASYGVQTAVMADLAGSYTVLSSGGAPVLSPVSAELACTYGVRAAVAHDIPGAFAVRAPAASDLSAAYQVRGRVWRDMDGSYAVLSAEDFTRAPAGSGYRGEAPAAPDTVVRVGPKVAAISLETARRAARAEEGDGLDDEVMLAAAGFTAEAEHDTQRCFIRQSWRATWRRFPAALSLSHAAPLADVVGVKYYDAAGILRTLDPRDYEVVADAEPAYIVPAAGCSWPATAERQTAVSVLYAAGYGADEASVPAEARLYVQAKVQQQFSPVMTAKPQNFESLLDGLKVYA